MLRLADDPTLRRLVEDRLAVRWSPQQMSRRLREEFPQDQSMWVSHETIYTSLFVQTKGVLRGELTANLRTKHVHCRPQKRISVGSRPEGIADMIGIHQRPVEVLDRSNPGHCEGDLLVGRYGRSHFVTLVERHSRYLIVLPDPDATTRTVVAAVTARSLELPDRMQGSLTWDRGVEMTRHHDFSAVTGVPVYFCDAYCPWQRGSSENTNGLLRQYFPKKKRIPVRPQDVALASSP
jgi:IS30 family transposase